MILEHFDNVGRDAPEETLEEMLRDLSQALATEPDVRDLYDEIRRRVVRDLMTGELAVTVIMPDLLDLLGRAPRKAILLMRLLAEPTATYERLGGAMGYSKQRAHVIVRELSEGLPWVRALLEGRGEGDRG